MQKNATGCINPFSYCLFSVSLLFISLACNETALLKGIPWVQFHAIDFTRPDYTGIDRQVNLDTGTAYRDYARIWIGRLKIPFSGNVEIDAECDDGCRLTIGDDLIIDGWHVNGRRRGSLVAQKNKWLRFRLEFFQNGGEAFLRLYWRWPDHARELIPESAFAHFPSDRSEIMRFAGQTARDTISRENRAIRYEPGNVSMLQAAERTAVAAFPGPHLLIDDFLIAEQSELERVIHQPQRDTSIQNPLITGKEDSCFQPFFTVSRRPEDNRFRIWYGAYRPDKNMSRSRLAYMESADGLHWQRPPLFCPTPEVQFGSEVIDRGPDWTPAYTRYVYVYWHDGGSRFAVSADGIHFIPLVDGVVLSHDHDITNLWWDPLRKHYVATVSTYMPSDRWQGSRRITLQSYSYDLLNWTYPAYVLYADPAGGDPGETQFYAMSAYLVRGPLVIGMVKVLRDDLQATEVSDDAFGRAHTSLAWSRDGLHWVRDQAAFFEPDANPEAWDHAHAWIDEQLIIDDQLYLYYGGYKQGHKKNRFEERQIGLVRIPIDRYVARAAGNQGGSLKTIPFTLNKTAASLKLNADASNGQIRVALLDPHTGQSLPGFGKDDCQPVHSNGLYMDIHWGTEKASSDKLGKLNGREIQIQFYLQNAQIYAFEFSNP